MRSWIEPSTTPIAWLYKVILKENYEVTGPCRTLDVQYLYQRFLSPLCCSGLAVRFDQFPQFNAKTKCYLRATAAGGMDQGYPMSKYKLSKNQYVEKGKPFRIGLQNIKTDPFWIPIDEEIVRRLGNRFIPLEIPDRAINLSANEQEIILEEILALELDALICLLMPISLFTRVLDAGIPLICLDETSFRHRQFYSVTGWEEAGMIAAQAIADRIQGKGRVLVASFAYKSGSIKFSESRLAGIRRKLDRYPTIDVHYVFCPADHDEAMAFLTTRPDIFKPTPDAIIGISDPLALAVSSVGRIAGLLPNDLPVVGINGDASALTSILEGSIYATVNIPLEGFAGQAVEIAIQAIHSNVLPPLFYFSPSLISKQNAIEVAVQKFKAFSSLPSRLAKANLWAEQIQQAQLTTSAAINQRVGRVLDQIQISRDIADLIRLNYAYDAVEFSLWNPEHKTIQRAYPDTSVSFVVPEDDAGIFGQVIHRNEPVFVPDMRYSTRFLHDKAPKEIRSRVLLPVRVQGHILGILDLQSHKPRVYMRKELIGLQCLADQLGIAIRDAQLYSEALHSREAAEKAYNLNTGLLANVSHELRGPLNVILGYSKSALSEEYPFRNQLPPEHLLDLEHIFRSGEHLSRLINDLLDLSRAEIGELDIFPELIDTRKILVDVFEIIVKQFPTSQVDWHWDVAEHLPAIHADPIRFRQILINLLSNAGKFTKQGFIILGAHVDPPHLHIWVQDSGVGVPIEDQERIFEPFVTINRGLKRSKGVGLGLSITRRLIMLHGGTLTLESREGYGSTFHLYLPLPSLTGRSAVFTTEPAKPGVMLLLSRGLEPGSFIHDLARLQNLQLRTLTPDMDLSALLTECNPACLVWDQSDIFALDLDTLESVREHPLLRRLPLWLYTPPIENYPASFTYLLIKPVARQTILELLLAFRSSVKQKSILIIDDDPQARNLYRRLALEIFPSAELFEAANGREGLELLSHCDPGVIILDLVMPVMNGFDFLDQLRSNLCLRHCPVLVLSGKLLTKEDIHRLNQANVLFQSKQVLRDAEIQDNIRRALKGHGTWASVTSFRVKQALVFIHENFHRPITRQEISSSVHVSESYLSKTFHQNMNMSLWEYLNRFRIARAQELLLSDLTLSISEVSEQVGFEDPSYFARIFRQITGLSPLKFRRQDHTTDLNKTQFS